MMTLESDKAEKSKKELPKNLPNAKPKKDPEFVLGWHDGKNFIPMQQQQHFMNTINNRMTRFNDSDTKRIVVLCRSQASSTPPLPAKIKLDPVDENRRDLSKKLGELTGYNEFLGFDDKKFNDEITKLTTKLAKFEELFFTNRDEYTRLLCTVEGIEYSMSLLKNHGLIDRALAQKDLTFMETIVNNVYLLGRRTFDEHKNTWFKNNAVNEIIKLLMKIDPYDQKLYNLRQIFYLALAQFVKEDEIPKLPDIEKIVNTNLNYLSSIVSLIRSYDKKKLKKMRTSILLDENELQNNTMSKYDTEKVVEISSLNNISIASVIEMLKKLALDEKIKKMMIPYMGYMIDLIYYGNYFEKYLGIKLLMAMSFNNKDSEKAKKVTKEVVDRLKADTAFLKYLKTISSISTIVTKINLKMPCEILIGQIQQTLNSKFNLRRSSLDKKTGHIMISYNHSTQPLCLKIKESLEGNGYKVWIGNRKIE
jgi:hypothetical protein